ncbi:MAG: glycerophosphodiester phosphodiesterase [Aquificae bacterium]|nr:glycerophosphodiester phosphodiesterase [Aquificota bacterium]
MKKPKIIAHRGYSSAYRENTWSAFKGAHEVGSDMIELDLVLTRDGKIFVNHDLDFKGTPIRDMELADLKRLIPDSAELEEVISWSQDSGIGLYLDIKDRDMIDVLTDVLKDINPKSNVVVSSSDDFPFMRRFKDRNSHIKTALLFRNLLPVEDMVALSRKYNGDIIHPCWENKHPTPHKLISEEDILHMNSEGFEVVCWHEEREEELRELIKKGFWGITTNNPQLLKHLIETQ